METLTFFKRQIEYLNNVNPLHSCLIQMVRHHTKSLLNIFFFKSTSVHKIPKGQNHENLPRTGMGLTRERDAVGSISPHENPIRQVQPHQHRFPGKKAQLQRSPKMCPRSKPEANRSQRCKHRQVCGIWKPMTQNKTDLNKDHWRHPWEKELVTFPFALTMASGTKNSV